MTPHKFRQIRDSMGASQAEFSEMLGIGREHVSKIENLHVAITHNLALSVQAIAILGPPATWPDSIDDVIDCTLPMISKIDVTLPQEDD